MKTTFGQTDDVIVTSDRSVLARAEGFWSKREILFNTQLNQVVLLDPDMTARELRELIKHVLERELFESLNDWQKNGANGRLKNRSGTFASSSARLSCTVCWNSMKERILKPRFRKRLA